MEQDGLLHPLEIKKASTLTLSMIAGFDTLFWSRKNEEKKTGSFELPEEA